jgi:hypothetical protein
MHLSTVSQEPRFASRIGGPNTAVLAWCVTVRGALLRGASRTTGTVYDYEMFYTESYHAPG